MDWSSKLTQGTMVASGMGNIGNDQWTSELKLGSIGMLSRDQCKQVADLGVLFKGTKFAIGRIVRTTLMFRWYDMWWYRYGHL